MPHPFDLYRRLIPRMVKYPRLLKAGDFHKRRARGNLQIGLKKAQLLVLELINQGESGQQQFWSRALLL